MASGKFILSVRKAGNDSFGILSAGDDQKFDDNSRFKANQRDGVLDFVKTRMAGWQHHYHAYRDASFRIEEYDNETGELKVVFGVGYPRAEAPEIGATRQALVTAASKAPKAARKTAEAMANWLFLQSEEGHLNPNAWRALDLNDRIEVCREVAAGFFTPAVL